MTNSPTENWGGGKLVKELYCILKQCYDLIVVAPKVTESLCLVLKKVSDGLNRVTMFELGSKWVFDEIYPCLIFIFLQGRLK
jgi:hypothetical protein